MLILILFWGGVVQGHEVLSYVKVTLGCQHSEYHRPDLKSTMSATLLHPLCSPLEINNVCPSLFTSSYLWQRWPCFVLRWTCTIPVNNHKHSNTFISNWYHYSHTVYFHSFTLDNFWCYMSMTSLLTSWLTPSVTHYKYRIPCSSRFVFCSLQSSPF